MQLVQQQHKNVSPLCRATLAIHWKYGYGDVARKKKKPAVGQKLHRNISPNNRTLKLRMNEYVATGRIGFALLRRSTVYRLQSTEKEGIRRDRIESYGMPMQHITRRSEMLHGTNQLTYNIVLID